MKTVRIPTQVEYGAYDGAHTQQLWSVLPEAWCCPGCSRSKFELLRWTKRVVSGRQFEGWIAALHRHHDHLEIGRFPRTVICELCNAVDGVATRRRSAVGGSPYFSYSPDEMRQFITGVPHGNHIVDWTKAAALYETLRPEITRSLINYCIVELIQFDCVAPGELYVERRIGVPLDPFHTAVLQAHAPDICNALYPASNAIGE